MRPIQTRFALTLLAFAMLAALASPVWAEPAKLKARVSVSSAIVTLGDLIENAGPTAGIPVFRAPDLGRTGYVAAARVAEAAAAHGLTGVDTAGLDEVAVTRLSRTVSSDEIEARLRAALQERLQVADPEALRLSLDAPLGPARLEPSARAELEIEQLDILTADGRFVAVLRVADAPGFRLRVSGMAAETVPVVTAARPIERGAVLSAADIELRRVPRASAGQALASPAEAEGLAARRGLRAGEPLRQGDLERPEAVARNALVTILYETPGLVLTVRGRAMHAGAVGEVISVTNLQSNRALQATITGPGRVVIAPAFARPMATAAR